MRAVGLKDLKNRLAEYVRLAASGEVILIADRDRVVAQLTAPEPARGATVTDAALADAVRNGLITPAALPPGPPPDVRGTLALDVLLEELDADREDR